MGVIVENRYILVRERERERERERIQDVLAA